MIGRSAFKVVRERGAGRCLLTGDSILTSLSGPVTARRRMPGETMCKSRANTFATRVDRSRRSLRLHAVRNPELELESCAGR